MQFATSFKSWSLILASLFFAFNLCAETRHIHVLKLFDNENHDPVIRQGCRSIGYGVDQEIAMLANYMGVLNVIEYNLSGPDFNIERLDQVLEYEMEYQERDIIVVVFVGHGFRDESTSSEFPKLYFNSYQETAKFSDIREQILDKNPSVLLNLIVACNVTLASQSTPPPYRSANSPPNETVTLIKGVRRHGAYHSLFADEDNMTKTIDLVSADREYYTFISNDGGVFFNETLYAFQEVLGGRPYDGWQAVCDTIQTRTIRRARHKGQQQKPICNYSVRLSPVVLPASRTRSLFDQSPCQLIAKGLRTEQREELRDLRRGHRENMRTARRSGEDRNRRRLLAQEQRVEYESKKLMHEKAYLRRLQQCR